jgi:predicted DNA-binding protein
MKDAVLTVRLPRATRARIEALAQKEGRSLSQQVERLVENALQNPRDGLAPPATRPLADALSGARVPDLAAFRAARRQLSLSLERRSRRPA